MTTPHPAAASGDARPGKDPASLAPDRPPGTHRSLVDAMDRIGITRAHKAVIALILAGQLFDTFQQDTSGAIGPYLSTTFGISTSELALINTMTMLGGLVGRMLAGYVADRYGRRFALSYNLLIYTLGGLISAFAPHYLVLLISRFIVGIGTGGELTVGLAMISEMVPTRRRGTAVASVNFVSSGVGNVFAFALFLLVLGPLNGPLGGDTHSWRWLYVFLAVPALMIVVFRRYLPESPRFLVATNRVHEANQVLTRLAAGRLRYRPTGDEVTPYLDASESFAEREKWSPLEVFRGAPGRRTVMMGIASWVAIGAFLMLLVLLPTLLVSKGFSVSSSLLYTLLINIGSLLGSGAAMLVASRWPRKVSALVGGLGACVSAILFGAIADGPALILVLGFVFQFFNLFVNTVLMSWSPELYPTRIRALGTSTVNAIGNVGGAVMPIAAAFIFDRSGSAGVFVLIGVMYALLIIASRFIPETLGRTLEEVTEQPAPQH
ncbi:MFS transporter [Amycolatopsis jejuensis]|uniref:MFS transporter n=1 Tax=Amycolatopsis jejuensis TaxID=330084 RepID=UPI000AFAAEAE|nr:MFS transporter [Amycolatopsis jejuensis]